MLTRTERGSWIVLILSLPLTTAMIGAWALAVSREGTHWLIQAAVFLALLAMIVVLTGAISSIQFFRRIKRDPLLLIEEKPRRNLLKEMLGPDDNELPEAEIAVRRFVAVLTAWMVALFGVIWLDRKGSRIELLSANGAVETLWNLFVVGVAGLIAGALLLYLIKLAEDLREDGWL